MPSRGFADAVAAVTTTVSPYLTITEPFASSATLPNSRLSFLPATSVSKILLISFPPLSF